MDSRHSPRSYWAGIILAIASASAFGLIPLFASPLISAGIPPQTVALYRFGLAAILLYPLLVWNRISLRLTVRNISALALLALFYFLDVQLFFYAFQYLASGITATLEFLAPVIVMLIMILFFHKRFHWQAGVSALVAIAGVALLSGAMSREGEFFFSAPAAATAAGVALALMAALFSALYMAGCEVCGMADQHPLVTTFYILLFGSAYCAAVSLATGTFALPVTAMDWIRGILLALITALFSNLALVMAIKRVGSVLTSILGVMEPLTAVLIGVSVFDEGMTSWMWFGVLLVILAALLASLGKK